MASPSCLTHISNLSPVTALAFVNTGTPNSSDPESGVSRPSLLVGEGPFIKILDTLTATSRLKRRIFSQERIHGILHSPNPDKQKILLWGGRSICITTLASLLEREAVFDEIQAPDWVFDAIFVPCPVSRAAVNVVVVTAHNSLLSYDPSSSSWRELARGDRCMLYSAHLLLLPPVDADPRPCHSLLVAAGTVFGEILIWPARLDSLNSLGDTRNAEKHYRLLGHEGSVFGVNISPRYEENKQYLASCSDDRTIRVWDISHLSFSSSTAETTEPKKTGFGHRVKSEGECMRIGWGHGARIWGVRFFPEPNNGKIWLLSISEDLTSKLWTLDPEQSGTITGGTRLENIATYMLHSGKNIWSYDLDFEKGLLATGGADGRICLVRYRDDQKTSKKGWDMQTVLDEVLGHPPEDQTQTRPKNKASKGQDTFREYAALDKDRFVATTTQGRVLVYTLGHRKWSFLGQWEGLRGWSILGAWEGTNLVALGNRIGEVGVIDVASRSEWWWEAAEGDRRKVAGVLLGKSGTGDGQKYFILTTALSPSVFSLHSFAMKSSHSPPLLIDKKTIPLSSPAGPGEPEFLVTSLSVNSTSTLLFLGSRAGELGVYDLTSKALPLSAKAYHPNNTHSSEAITTILPIPFSSTADILTTSRNGGYSLLALSSNSGPPATHHSSNPNFVIEGAEYAPGSHLYLWGFRGKHFILYSETNSHEVSTIECGGAHRAWAFHLNSWFVWTKAGKANFTSLHPYQNTIQQGLHGREIKSVAIHGTALATGSEDTWIRLSTLSKGSLLPCGRAKKHTTGVHALLFSPCGKYLFSAGGAGEFFVWRVNSPWAIAWEGGCQARADLRVEGFDVIPKGDGFLVALGYSDSTIRIYEYDVGSRSFKARLSARYKQCCILHLKLLADTLLVAGTDGFIAGYELQLPHLASEEVHGLGKLKFEKRVHQNSIKALYAYQEDDGTMWVYSGGDDTALAVTRVRSGGENPESWVLARAHASAVTALVRIGGNRVLTAGVDQRVKLWEMVKAEGGQVVAAKLVEEGMSAVADISGAVVAGDQVVIVGVGVDVWETTLL